MNKNKVFIAVAAVAAGALVFAGRGFAVDAGAGVGVRYSVQGNVSGSENALPGVEVRTEGNATSGERMQGASEAASGSIETGIKVRLEHASGSAEESGSSTDIGAVISASAKDLRGWDAAQKEQFMNTVKTEAEVRSGQDLQNFANGILVKDGNVESVDVATGTVKVSYREPAKLFGIFNTGLTVQVAADANGHATVSYPWYRFLFSMPSSTASAHLAAAINAGLSGMNLESNVQALAHALGAITGILAGSSSSTVSSGGQ